MAGAEVDPIVTKSRGTRREALDRRHAAQRTVERATTFFFFAAGLSGGGIVLLLSYGLIGGLLKGNHENLLILLRSVAIFGLVMLITGWRLPSAPMAWAALAALAETARLLLLPGLGPPELTWRWILTVVWLALLWSIAGRLAFAERVLGDPLPETPGEPPPPATPRGPETVVVSRTGAGKRRFREAVAGRQGLRKLSRIYFIAAGFFFLPLVMQFSVGMINILQRSPERALDDIVPLLALFVPCAVLALAGSRLHSRPVHWALVTALFFTASAVTLLTVPPPIHRGEIVFPVLLICILVLPLWLMVLPARKCAALSGTSRGSLAVGARHE